jgi:hypothetical protein
MYRFVVSVDGVLTAAKITTVASFHGMHVAAHHALLPLPVPMLLLLTMQLLCYWCSKVHGVNALAGVLDVVGSPLL